MFGSVQTGADAAHTLRPHGAIPRGPTRHFDRRPPFRAIDAFREARRVVPGKRG
jgi:hypothetical protein